MFEVEYYYKENGSCPATEYLDSIPRGQGRDIKKSIEMLEEYGLVIIGTNRLKPIETGKKRKSEKGQSYDLYELIGGRHRIAVYHDKSMEKFMLLNGFFKDQRKCPQGTQYAFDLRKEYLERKLK